MAQTARKLRCIIIDDEEPAVKNLSLILDTYCNNIEVAGTAHSAREGVGLINREKPDMVFLDIEMPNNNGFTLLDELGELNFKLVFVTAYSEYAIQAIKFSALDYLLKPIKADEVLLAIEKSIKSGYKSRMNFYDNLLKNLATDRENQSIILKENDRSTVVRIADIVRFESDRNYTQVCMKTGETVLLSKTLKIFDEMLKDHGFLRIHKSHLINSANIDKILLKEHCVLLTTGEKVKFSTRKKKELSDFLKNMSVR